MIKNICVWGAVIGLVVSSAACSKKSDGGAAAAGSGTTAAATTGAATAAAAKKPKATLKSADVRALYKAEVDNNKMNVPIDKKVATFNSKIGAAPAADDGRKKTYYGLDGETCTKFEMDSKYGSLAEQNVDKSECGL